MPIQLPEIGSYDDYCVWQHQFTSDLTLESPEVRAWIEFATNKADPFRISRCHWVRRRFP